MAAATSWGGMESVAAGNVTCVGNSDCYHLSMRLRCFANVCGCNWAAAETGVGCMQTAESAWAVGVRSLSVLMYVAPTVYCARILARRRRQSAISCSFIVSTVVLVLVAAVSLMLSHLLQLINFFRAMSVPAGPETPEIHENFRLVCEQLGGMCTIVGCLNVSMMWVEFGLASRRLESMSSSLQLTRKYTGSFMVVYVLASVLFATLNLADKGAFYYAFTALMVASALTVVASFQYGGGRLAAAYRRAALLSESMQQTTRKHTDESSRHSHGEEGTPSGSVRGADGGGEAAAAAAAGPVAVVAAPPELRTGEDARSAGEEARVFDRRARIISWTSRAVTVTLGTFSASCALWFLMNRARQRELMWVAIFLIHVAVSSTQLAVCRFVQLTLEPTTFVGTRTVLGMGVKVGVE